MVEQSEAVVAIVIPAYDEAETIRQQASNKSSVAITG